jgi:glucan phosphoethanolaminetransferase (alkaline phosphatase superfamily)
MSESQISLPVASQSYKRESMKITKKQEQEIDWMEKWGINEVPFISTQEEKEEYIQHTVYGNKTELNLAKNTNRLFQAKRGFDMTFKMWREDMAGKISNGWPLITKRELLEDFSNHPFLVKALKNIRESR